jgi:hypothetical protein
VRVLYFHAIQCGYEFLGPKKEKKPPTREKFCPHQIGQYGYEKKIRNFTLTSAHLKIKTPIW